VKSASLVEWLAVAAIVAVLIAVLMPSTRWAASGSIRLPIRVVVFDAARQRPIEGAEVSIFRSIAARDSQSFPPLDAEAPSLIRNDGHRSVTGRDGAAVIDHEFPTSASDRFPTTKAHLAWEWVLVSSKGHGTVLTPLRYESIPTKTLRDQKELLVLIGMMKSDRVE
jgi:hypothetical protein